MKAIFVGCLLLVFASANSHAQDQGEFDSGFDWLSLSEAQALAEEDGKKILLFGYAEWCTYCLKMRKETYPDSTVLSSLSQYYHPVQVDAESEEEINYNGRKMKSYELARFLRITSFPTHFFIDSDGTILGAQPGFIEPYVFSPLLNYVGTGAFQTMGFEEYFEIEDDEEGGE